MDFTRKNLACLHLFSVLIFCLVNFAEQGGASSVSHQSVNQPSFIAANKRSDELAELRSKVEKLESTLERLMGARSMRSINTSGGVTYVRWGRTTCDRQDSVRLYKGYAAGNRFDKNGSGTNYLCVHEEPQWKNIRPDPWSGYLFGVEYEHFGVFSSINNHGLNLMNQPAPCAVCYVPTRSAKVMIPARRDCPAGWTREYGGYLASQAQAQDGRAFAPTSYICWDEAPEVAHGGISQNHGLVYPVKFGCGSLPCSKFINGWDATCVVCTK